MVSVKDRLETVYSYLKNQSVPKREKIIFITKDSGDYVLEGYALSKLMYPVEVREIGDNILETVRQAGQDARYVYVERDNLTTSYNFELKRIQDINAALGDRSIYLECKAIGLLDFILNGMKLDIKRKHVMLYGYDRDIMDMLVKQGATVTVIHPDAQPYGLDLFGVSLVITLPGYKKNLNCYPIHVPVIDVANCCINIENREVVTDCEFLRLLGLLVQLW